MIRLTVFGTAKPQGSKTAFAIKGTNRAVLREGSSPAANVSWKAWRDAVSAAARSWQEANNVGLLDESLEVSIVFYFARPKSAPRWKLWASTSDDADKLARAVNDSLTGTIFVNDARIVRLFVEKLYTLDAPRAEITIIPLGVTERAGTFAGRSAS